MEWVDGLVGSIQIIIVQADCGKLLQVPQVLLELVMHIPQMLVLWVITPVVLPSPQELADIVASHQVVVVVQKPVAEAEFLSHIGDN